MGRRKKEDQELELQEPTEGLDENPEIDEAAQAELEANEEESPAGAETKSEDETKKEEKAEAAPAETPKPRKRRQRRKKADEPQALLTTTPIENPKAEEAASTPHESPHLREDVAVAEVSIHKSMDSMVKQWASVKDISTSVCTNLERVASFLKELESNYATASQELAKRENNRNRLVTRVAVGSSAIALVLSLVSLSLSQSTRQVALGGFAKKAQSTDVISPAHTAERPQVAPTQESGSLASNAPTFPGPVRARNRVTPKPSRTERPGKR